MDVNCWVSSKEGNGIEKSQCCRGSAIFIANPTNNFCFKEHHLFTHPQFLSLSVWKCSILRDWKEWGTHGRSRHSNSLSSAISRDLLKYQKYIRVQQVQQQWMRREYLQSLSSPNVVSFEIVQKSKNKMSTFAEQLCKIVHLNKLYQAKLNQSVIRAVSSATLKAPLKGFSRKPK